MGPQQVPDRKPGRWSRVAWFAGTGCLSLVVILTTWCCTVIRPRLELDAIAAAFSEGDITHEEALRRLGGPEAAAERLLESARIPGNRTKHCYAVRLVAGAGQPVVKPLTKGLEHSAANVRACAAFALGEVGPEAEEVVPQLVNALSDESHHVRERAAVALGNVARRATESVPALIGALEDEYWLVRFKAARSLGKFGGEAEEAVPDLVELLSADLQLLRYAGAEALGNIGPKARPAVPHLHKATRDASDEVRRAAEAAISRILRPEEAPEDQSGGMAEKENAGQQ
jgi:hypothetical protein